MKRALKEASIVFVLGFVAFSFYFWEATAPTEPSYDNATRMHEIEHSTSKGITDAID